MHTYAHTHTPIYIYIYIYIYVYIYTHTHTHTNMQAEAERRKRAQILDSEAEQMSDINIAEGRKQSQVCVPLFSVIHIYVHTHIQE
jgi:hypothetical protein